MAGDQTESGPRIQGLQHGGILKHPPKSQRSQHEEPKEHHGSEIPADDLGAAALQGEQTAEDQARGRDDDGVGPGPNLLHAFDCAEDGDGGGYHRLSAQHRRPRQNHQGAGVQADAGGGLQTA